jgi:hypothetical protein
MDVRNAVSITTEPTYPKQNQDFVVSLESYAVDLKVATISFFSNGVLIQKQEGVSKATIPHNSKKTVVDIIIETQDGRVIEKTTTIVPGSVSLVWKANTYTPPFYKGRALLTEEATLVVSAVPDIYDANGNKINARDINYTWRVNSKLDQAQSGLGRNTIVINKLYLDPSIRIILTAQSKDRKFGASEYIEVPYTTPVIALYKNDPTQGIDYSNSLSKITTSEKEMELYAVPYYFGVFTHNASDLAYNWKVNGEKTTNTKNSVVLRNDTNKLGLVNVSLDIENIRASFQNMQKRLIIEIVK